MKDLITVVIVDDHSVVRQGVRVFLETHDDIEIAGEAASSDEAVRLCDEFAPDVVLLDLLMPDRSGVETTKLIKLASPRSQVVILTSYHDDDYIVPAIEAGALSYLLKDVSPAELVQAVRRAALGEATLHPRVAAHIMQSLKTKKPEFNEFDRLSSREMEVLRLVAEGCSNLEIANRLFISEKTVKSHVSNILSKLHLVDRTQAAVYAWRHKIVQD